LRPKALAVKFTTFIIYVHLKSKVESFSKPLLAGLPNLNYSVEFVIRKLNRKGTKNAKYREEFNAFKTEASVHGSSRAGLLVF
jgi:hypothetical protein